MPKRDELISDLLGEDETELDHSLRAKSLRRATGCETPRTLTPDEWVDWYAEHGVPADHKQPVEKRPRSRLLAGIRRWFGL